MSDPLRLWYLIDAYTGPNAGSEKQLLVLIERMTQLGHDVRLFVLRDTPYTRETSDFPCPIEPLEVGSMASLATARRMLEFRGRIRTERPNVLHAYFNDCAILAPLFCKTPGTKVFTSRRDMGFWHTPTHLRLLRLANLRADSIVCNSQAVADLVARKEKAPASKLLVIRNGIDITPENQPREPDQDVPGFDPGVGTFNACLVANLRPIKRIEDFIQAASRVSAQLPGARFWIAGESLDDAYEAELKSLVEELALGGAVHFLGDVRYPMRLMRACHVGVLCSESEGLSNTLMEYMSVGLPSICSKVGGNPELVENGVSGFLYPVGNVEALAALLLELGTNEALRQRLADAARSSSRMLSIEAMVAAHLTAYTAIRGNNSIGGLRLLRPGQ